MWLYQTAAGHYSYFSEHESNTIFIILNIYSIFKAKTSGISDADMSVLTAVNVITRSNKSNTKNSFMTTVL